VLLKRGIRRGVRFGSLVLLSVLSFACAQEGSHVATRVAATPTLLRPDAIGDTLRRAHPDAVVAGADVQFPHLTLLIHPAWEKLEGNTGKAGFYLVEMIVDENGRVIDAAFLRGSDREIQELIRSAINQWHFRPAQKAGKPVKCILDVSFGVHRGAS
jgi:hypothetical protein